MKFEMKQVAWSGAALMMALSSAALADNLPAKSSDAAAPTSSVSSGASHMDARQQVTRDLQQAGFTDVKVIPDSFLVQAKDKSGNPVTMFINPTSMTMVTRDMPANASTKPNANANTNASGSMFTDVASGESLSSKVIGLNVYNNNNQDIGEIKDVAFDHNGVRAYIVSVGGFLGMGDHYVAVSPSAVNITHDANSDKWHAEMNTNAAQLKSAPEYKYSSAM
jgi:hypothetical protein